MNTCLLLTQADPRGQCREGIGRGRAIAGASTSDYVVIMTAIETATTRAADGWPRKAWTHNDLDRMTEAGLIGRDEHVELIDGEIIPMPAKGVRHERVRQAINEWIYSHLGRDKIVLPELGWRPEPRFYLEPDFLVVPRTVVPPEFHGRDVLLAVEVADTSLDYDSTIKRDRYAGLGVREYWVVDAWALNTRVHRAPGATGYSAVEEVPATARLAPLLAPELALRLADLAIA